MLELPEVLTLSKQANDVLSGKTITGTILQMNCFIMQ